MLYALRSIRSPGLRFVVAAPGRFFPDYSPSLMPADVAALGVHDGDEVLVLVIVTVTNGIADATANLLAPIVIAAGRGTAVQLVLPDSDLPLRAPLLARGRLALRPAGPAHPCLLERCCADLDPPRGRKHRRRR